MGFGHPAKAKYAVFAGVGQQAQYNHQAVALWQMVAYFLGEVVVGVFKYKQRIGELGIESKSNRLIVVLTLHQSHIGIGAVYGTDLQRF